MSKPRFAEFVLWSKELSGVELVALLGEADAPVQSRGEFRGAGAAQRMNEESTWLLRSSAPDDAPIETHLNVLYQRVRQRVTGLDPTVTAQLGSVLRIVQYMSSREFQGHGIPIGSDWVAILASLHGEIDIDQYVVEA